MPPGADALWAWHARPAAFERLPPPWEPVALLHRTGERLEDGLRVTLGIGPGPSARPGWPSTAADGSGRSVLEDDRSVAPPLHGLAPAAASLRAAEVASAKRGTEEGPRA